jgi:hypothetical protein
MRKETKAWLLDVFNSTIDAGIAFLRKNLKEGIATVGRCTLTVSNPS